MKTNKIVFQTTMVLFFVFLFLIFVFFKQAIAQTAELTQIFTKIDKENFFNPDSLFLDVAIDNQGGTSFNAAGININFDPQKIQIAKIDYKNSFCDLIVKETVDNASGTLDLICGSLTPVNSATTTIARLEFIKLSSGFTTVDLAGSELICADGSGKQISTITESNNIYLYRP